MHVNTAIYLLNFVSHSYIEEQYTCNRILSDWVSTNSKLRTIT